MRIFNKKESQFECNHIFDNYIRIADPRRMCVTFHLKCMLCNKPISVNVTTGMLADLYSDITLNHINPSYVKAVSNEKDLYNGSTGQNIDFPNSHVHSENNSLNDKLF